MPTAWTDWLSLLSPAPVPQFPSGRAIGLYSASAALQPHLPLSLIANLDIRLLGERVPADETTSGVRGFTEHRTDEGRFDRVNPLHVHRSSPPPMGRDRLGVCWATMLALARAMPIADVPTEAAYRIYAEFRPEVPHGLAGWGQPGRLVVGAQGDPPPLPAAAAAAASRRWILRHEHPDAPLWGARHSPAGASVDELLEALANEQKDLFGIVVDRGTWAAAPAGRRLLRIARGASSSCKV